MEAVIEFALIEPLGSKFLLASDGQLLSNGEIKVVAKVGSPLYERIRRADELARRPKPWGHGSSIYSHWKVIRNYTDVEIQSAELFTLALNRTFHFAGEEYGTVYLEDKACPLCGGGAERVGPLVLDLRKAPKKHEIAATLADEYIVSQKLAERFVAERITGCELKPVVHRAFRKEPPMDFGATLTGKQLLYEAEKAGVAGWHLQVWLYSAERSVRAKQAEREFRALHKLKKATSPSLPRWYELVINSQPLRTIKPTRWGQDIFGRESPREFTIPKISVRSDTRGRWDRWPNGNVCLYANQYDHVKDFRILSEAFVSRDDWDGSDMCRSVELAGYRMGLSRPTPYRFVSPKLRKLLLANANQSVELEVAYFH